jgi:sporulation protein YlmC with PRC-barrel domain
MPYFSQFVGLPVVDARGAPQGKLADMVVSSDKGYPEINALVVSPRRRGETVYVPWSEVESIKTSCVLRDPLSAIHSYVPGEHEIRLGRQVLDRQIVDVEGRKVVRVNDLQLTRTNGHFRLVGVDVSPQALLRRIGVSPFASKLGIRPREQIIPWAEIDPIGSDTHQIRLRVTQQHLSKMRPADLAEIVEDLSLKEGVALFAQMDTETAADALEEVAPERQVSLLESLDRDRAADILEEMDPDDAADVLGEMSDEKANELLSLMDQDEQEDVRELLAYPEDSAGGIMTTEYVAVLPTLTAQQIIDHLRTACRDMDVIHYVYVVAGEDDETLLGVTSLHDVIMADPSAPVRTFMNADPVTLKVSDTEEYAAKVIAKYNLMAVPVLDAAGHLAGIVTVDDAIDIILPTAWKKRLPRLYA